MWWLLLFVLCMSVVQVVWPCLMSWMNFLIRACMCLLGEVVRGVCIGCSTCLLVVRIMVVQKLFPAGKQRNIRACETLVLVVILLRVSLRTGCARTNC